jgi:hypothetical protein
LTLKKLIVPNLAPKVEIILIWLWLIEFFIPKMILPSLWTLCSINLHSQGEKGNQLNKKRKGIENFLQTWTMKAAAHQRVARVDVCVYVSM